MSCPRRPRNPRQPFKSPDPVTITTTIIRTPLTPARIAARDRAMQAILRGIDRDPLTGRPDSC
jgi:hypothetical protein